MKQKLIMADIHSNIAALRSVFDDVELDKSTEIICLGDLVGYGPAPNKCVKFLRELEADVIAGNHDAASCGLVNSSYFNRFARKAVDWTRDQLNGKNLRYLKNLPKHESDEYFEYYHGSPLEPLTEYITTNQQAQDALESIDRAKLAVGHTHQPMLYRVGTGLGRIERISGEKTLHEISTDEQLVINPGSVGQPRDGNPRAAYVMVKINKNQRLNIEWKRVSYDIESVQKDIRSAGLPEALASRLPRGK